ncbi:MAG: DUF927 domain-containing protein [Selenomonadaceae bacterium]|nr:DUF927 domain-containing protein [Selenomonadaceae bacterium]
MFIPKSKNPREISTSQRKFLEGKYSTSNAVFSIDTENQQIKMICEHCSAVRYVVENIETQEYSVVVPILRTLLKIEGSEQFIFDLVKRWRGDKFDISKTEKQLEGLKKLPPAQCLDLLAKGLSCNGGEKHECVVASLGKKTPDAIRKSPIVRRAICQDLGGTIGERFADAPDQIKYLSIPDVFEMYENGIDLVTEKSSKSVSLTPFAIQNLVQNEGSESIAYYNFAIRKNGRWIHRLIDAHIINKTADLANALLDYGILVDASQIRLANKFIIAFLATNEDNIETITQYTKLGWCDNFEFIHPEFQFDNAGNALYKLIQSDVVPHIHCKGNIESEIELMKRACKYQNARAMYNMQFLAPLVKPLGIRNPILYICAESESGKTAAMVGANSVFGDPEFMIEINGTKKSLVDRFIDRNDLPTNFNEWQHIAEKDRTAYAENLIRTFESGKSRGKENRDGSQVPIKKYRGTLTITSEKELLNENDPHDLRTRCILLSVDGVVGNTGNDGNFITDNETCHIKTRSLLETKKDPSIEN